tara:strand:- start:31 stop:390 length:360 start_codon:yes stop_codon:yes gene_type:complete
MKITTLRLKEIIKEEIDDLFIQEKDIILEGLADNLMTPEEPDQTIMDEGIFDILSSLVRKQQDPTEKENLLAVQSALAQLNPNTLKDVQDTMSRGVTVTGNPQAARKTPWDMMEDPEKE